jgi:hypothetical protein
MTSPRAKAGLRPPAAFVSTIVFAPEAAASRTKYVTSSGRVPLIEMRAPRERDDALSRPRTRIGDAGMTRERASGAWNFRSRFPFPRCVRARSPQGRCRARSLHRAAPPARRCSRAAAAASFFGFNGRPTAALARAGCGRSCGRYRRDRAAARASARCRRVCRRKRSEVRLARDEHERNGVGRVRGQRVAFGVELLFGVAVVGRDREDAVGIEHRLRQPPERDVERLDGRDRRVMTPVCPTMSALA